MRWLSYSCFKLFLVTSYNMTEFNMKLDNVKIKTFLVFYQSGKNQNKIKNIVRFLIMEFLMEKNVSAFFINLL